MLIIEIVFNLAILVTASVLAGFIDNRWNRTTKTGIILQGFLFGAVATLAMLKPFIMIPGIIFDGRSVVLSLCALFFGPVSGAIAGVIAIITRLHIGGAGSLMGVSVIIASVAIGSLFHFQNKKKRFNTNFINLFTFGLIVHIVMILFMIALPTNMRLETIQKVGISVIVAYPIATIILGKILADQENGMTLITALSESEGKFRSLVESAFDAIYLMEGRHYTYVNPGFCRLTGYTFDELTAEGFDFSTLLTEKSIGIIEKRYAARQTGEVVPSQYETQIKTKSGIIKDVEVSTTLLGENRAVHVIGIMRDISERKEAEAEIIQKNIELKQVNDEKDKLFSIISHDLRGSFGAFIGLLGLAADEKEELTVTELRHACRIILKSANDLNTLLENLLDWSRLKRGVLQMDTKQINLRILSDECIRSLADLTNRKKIFINNLIPENDAFIFDRNMIMSVFRNLLSNAIKFTPKGGKVTISTSLSNENSRVICIADTGVGIDQETLKSILDTTLITPNFGTEGEPGTGLGLIICKEFVEKHGGDLWAESEPGKGSQFYFSLNTSNDFTK